MQWHEFVFSEKKQVRLLRHILFWIMWGLYIYVCDILFQQPSPTQAILKNKTGYVTLGLHALPKTLLLVTLYVIACYFFIYFLLPQLIKGKWLKAIINTFLLFVFLFTATWLMYWNLFPFIDSLYGPYKVNDYYARFWPAVYLGIINAIKVVASAAIIKYVKYWWLKQKESERLEREKINAELQLLKAQIHPGFLFNALNNLYVYSLAASPRTPELLAKLSDLLSYMLYECNDPLVPLDKEIAMMKDYLELEKTRLNDTLEMELTTTGDMNGKMISPFLLLPFIENSFKQTARLTEQSWINLDFSIDGNTFHMKLANGMPPATNGLPDIPVNGLANVQKRLTLIYPQKHELKITREQEMLVLHLEIQLSETIANAEKADEKPAIPEFSADKPTIYAFR